MNLTGYWSLIYQVPVGLIGLSFMVFIHEFGHFFVAKKLLSGNAVILSTAFLPFPLVVMLQWRVKAPMMVDMGMRMSFVKNQYGCDF